MMKITIGIPYALNKIGKRPHQEDCIMPQPSADAIHENCFVLCDGMGGYAHGDMAGQLVATSFYQTVKEGDHAAKAPDRTIADGIEKAFDALDGYAQDCGCNSMGTTLAALYLTDSGYYAIHIGDSRIYHIRPSLYTPGRPKECLLYKSWDHSLVNLMVRIGELNEEEAEAHPKKNVLIKAMQPDMGKSRSSADIIHSTDVLSGDYFFLASDGVTGCVKDDVLCSIFADKDLSDADRIAMIDRLCEENGNDNYSCWLIPVQ